VKGFDCWLCSSRKLLIAAWRSATERNTPRFSRRFVSMAKKPSTAPAHDLVRAEPVGLKRANVLLRSIAVPDQSFQLMAIDRRDRDRFSCASHRLARKANNGNPKGTQSSATSLQAWWAADADLDRLRPA
jgi:hypothetical protein